MRTQRWISWGLCAALPALTLAVLVIANPESPFFVAIARTFGGLLLVLNGMGRLLVPVMTWAAIAAGPAVAAILVYVLKVVFAPGSRASNLLCAGASGLAFAVLCWQLNALGMPALLPSAAMVIMGGASAWNLWGTQPGHDDHEHRVLGVFLTVFLTLALIMMIAMVIEKEMRMSDGPLRDASDAEVVALAKTDDATALAEVRHRAQYSGREAWLENSGMTAPNQVSRPGQLDLYRPGKQLPIVQCRKGRESTDILVSHAHNASEIEVFLAKRICSKRAAEY